MDKHFTKYFNKHDVYLASSVVTSDLKVVVPVFLEEESLFNCITSQKKASLLCDNIIELILVFNYSESAAYDIKQRQDELMNNVKHQLHIYQTASFKITIIEAFNLPSKYAGVGYARKIGMDYAAKVFAEKENPDGIIVSLDADSIVEENYFTSIIKYFNGKSVRGCSIYYEHPMEGVYNVDVYNSVAEYELHLRFYVQALRWTGFPYAYHTVGSCFAVTADTYVRAGGMPRKQAGEDFYFLQKAIPLGGFAELNTTTVYPSSRPSDRVPFGTGPTINKIIEAGEKFQTYNLQAFVDLKELLYKKEQLYKVTEEETDGFVHQFSESMRSYLLNSDFFRALKPVNDNCSTLDVFNKRFYEVFNAFRVVKYLNYTHTHFFKKVPVFDSAFAFYEMLKTNVPDATETKELLMLYRRLEKSEL